MIDRAKARASALLTQHMPAHADAVSTALHEPWERLRHDRHLVHTEAFLRATDGHIWSLSGDRIAPHLATTTCSALPSDARAALEALRPWRKGPFQVADLTIDAEWRSEQKWDRVRPLMGDLTGRVVVDVGSNNGYYAHRLLAEGAAAVFGLEPQPLYLAQALCFEARIDHSHAVSLPVGLDVLAAMRRSADLLLLMGILYHHTDPLHVLRLCAGALKAGGNLLVETIVIEGEENTAVFVPSTYTGAKGFYWLPTVSCLRTWIRRSGLRILEEHAPVATTADEQRVTAWREGRSLPEGLNAEDPSRTSEGLPAPQRMAIRCTIA